MPEPVPVVTTAPGPTVSVIPNTGVIMGVNRIIPIATSSGPPPGGYAPVTINGQPGKTSTPIGPSQDPSVPRTLAAIDYRPLTTARLGAPIPLGYGRFKTGGLIARAKKYGNELLVLVVWCEGEVDAVEAVFSDQNDITILTQIQAYTGTQAQTGNSTIAAEFGQADTLAGICYSVLSLRAVDTLNLSVIIRGTKVYDPREDDYVYTANAALCLADFISRYKPWEIDWSAAEYAADYCDATIASGVKRWEVNMPLADQKSPDEWISVLAEYANCFVFVDGGVARIIPDEPRDVDHVLTAADIVQDSLDLRKLGQHDVPTQVFCEYTVVPTTGEWTESEEYTDDPLETDPLRVTRLRMLGFQKATQAKRKAVQFQNYAALADLVGSVGLFDAGARITKGDVISITHPTGLTAKEFRVLDCVPTDKGRWRAEIREYSNLLYSTAVVSNPNIPDTDLPLVTDVPEGPTPSEIREVLFTDQTGTTYTRFEIRFDGVEWPFARNYRVQMSAGSVVVMDTLIAHRGSEEEHLVTTPPTAQGVEYTVRVWVVSSIGGSSATPGELTKTGDGKTIPPTNPSGLTGREANQFVALSWTASVDSDLRGYQVRRLGKDDYDAAGSAAARWDHANVVTLIERIDSTRCALESQPIGEHYYMVKALDFAGNFSVGFTAKLILVTEDEAGAVQTAERDEQFFDNMYDEDRRVNEGITGGRVAYTSFHDTWLGICGIAGVNAWEDVWDPGEHWGANEQGSFGLDTLEWDLGDDANGTFAWGANITHHTGPINNVEIGVKAAADVSYTYHAGRSVAAVARYAKGRIYDDNLVIGTLLSVRLPVDFKFVGVRVFDSGSESVPGTGQPLAVAFNKQFAFPPTVRAQLLGSTPGFANPDNVTATGFDLYAWDVDGAEMAADVAWTADGA